MQLKNGFLRFPNWQKIGLLFYVKPLFYGRVLIIDDDENEEKQPTAECDSTKRKFPWTCKAKTVHYFVQRSFWI